MLEKIIEYLNLKLIATDFYEMISGIAQPKTRDNITHPMIRCNGVWEPVTKFSEFNGLSYWLLNGEPSSSQIENIVGCEKLYNVTTPLRLVSVIPKQKLEKDDFYVDQLVANTIQKALTGTDNTVKTTLRARRFNIDVDNWQTISQQVWASQYVGTDQIDQDDKYSYLYVDFTVEVQITEECLEDLCNVTEFDILCPVMESATDQEIVNCIQEQGRTEDICSLLACPTDLDPDALAYLNSQGITNEVERQAVNEWVLTVKGKVNSANPTGIDLWTSKILHWWPISPTSLSAATGNIRNPLYPITWVNTPTHTVNGVQGNGTTQYARFGVVPSTDLTYEDTNFCVYIRTNQQRNEMDMGAFSADFNEIRCGTRYSSPGSVLSWNYTRASELRFTNSNSQGFWAFERTGTTMNVYGNGVLRGTRSVGTPDALPSVEMYGMAYNNNGSPLEVSSKQYATWGITTSLTPTEHNVLSDANYIYQLTVIAGGRAV